MGEHIIHRLFDISAIIPILQPVVLPWFFDIQEDWKQY